MPYLPVDLDAKRKAHGIERALGLPRHSVAGGLTDLWEVVWREKSAVVDDLTLDEAFGSDLRIRIALVARGFLEPTEGGHRVRGAARWLFGLEGKSRGGKAAKANLRRGTEPGCSAGEPGPEGNESPASAGAKPEPTSGTKPGSYTQHPAPSTQKPLAGDADAAPPEPVSAFGGMPVKQVLDGAVPGRRVEDRPTGPVVESLRDRMEATYLEIRKTPYRWRRADDEAVRMLPHDASDEEILRVWASGLNRSFPRCLSVSTLAEHWSEYAGPPPGAGSKPKPEAAPAPMKHLG